MTYRFGIGAVQPYIYDPEDLTTFLWFGAPQYDSRKPVFSESLREQAQPILDALNAGTMTDSEARQELRVGARW